MTTSALVAVVTAATVAVAVTLGQAFIEGPIGLSLVGLLLCWIVFSVWPWSVLPIGILGGTFVAALIGRTDVGSVVATHLALLFAGVAALVTRRVLGMDEPVTIARPCRVALLIVGATLAVGCVYGFAVGNVAWKVVVAAYEVGVIPMYFLATMYTLGTARRRRQAAVLYVVGITVLTVLELATPGRHGGLFSLLALPLLIVSAGRSHGWKQAGMALAAATLCVDVVLASYRGLWVATAVFVVVLAARGGRDVRRGLAATGLACASLAVVLAFTVDLSGGLESRLAVVREAQGRDAGYRVPEATIGWNVFAAEPLFGAGLGQSTRNMYVPGFKVEDVGPNYHSFYILLLANLGLIGAAAVLWSVTRPVWTAIAGRDSVSLALAALACGFLVAASVSAPTDGHWELGVLAALIALTLPSDVAVDGRPVRGGRLRSSVPAGALR